MSLKTLSLAAFALAVFSVVYLLNKQHIFSSNILVISIQVLSVALMIWARITLGARSFHASATATKGPLVSDGPYRWFRHPIYATLIFLRLRLLRFRLLMPTSKCC